jgi:hypothetical protein
MKIQTLQNLNYEARLEKKLKKVALKNVDFFENFCGSWTKFAKTQHTKLFPSLQALIKYIFYFHYMNSLGRDFFF